jgi:excisionase family DNA binding protein
MQTTEKILTLQEVADYLRVPIRRIREAVRNREIEFLDFSPPGSTRPKTRRFTQAAVDRWMQSLSQQKEPQIL